MGLTRRVPTVFQRLCADHFTKENGIRLRYGPFNGEFPTHDGASAHASIGGSSQGSYQEDNSQSSGPTYCHAGPSNVNSESYTPP